MNWRKKSLVEDLYLSYHVCAYLTLEAVRVTLKHHTDLPNKRGDESIGSECRRTVPILITTFKSSVT